MFKQLKLLSIAAVIALSVGLFSLVSPQLALAEISNPAIGSQLGSGADNAKAGIPFSIYFITLWRGIITVGGLMVFIFFLWGAIEWISAGGDSGKVGKARDRITQSIIGFLLLVSTAIIISFLGKVFFGDTFNFFQLSVPFTSTDGSGLVPTSKSSNTGNTPGLGAPATGNKTP